jgi:GT2 family glycosyltransferase
MKSKTEDMRRSVMVQKYNCLMDRVLPHDTKRRNAYDLFLKSCQILTDEGPVSLLRQYNERKRDRILEKEQELWRKNNAKKFKKYSLKDIEKDRIEFPKISNNCEVSIVIPVHNNAKYTYNCLRSLSEATRGSFEVIVINDASIDETEDLLKNIENIKIIKNDENQGFIASCNRGAKSSRGKYILFLNNDTILTDNWLELLVEAIKEDKAGAVGAKLIYPDGKLQEAGGIIWNDASGWNYGRGDDPQKPEYNFARDVDYCSGAALLVRKDLFERYGGFDTRFKPAYYEDTDLCFNIRSQGYRVLYQPRSVVVHFEGENSGKDATSSTKRYQEINKLKFFDKWRDVLDKEHYKPDSRNVFMARIHKTGKNILVIDHCVPTFDKDSGSYRMYNFLKILVEIGHKVTFIGDNLKQVEPTCNNQALR